MHPPFHSTVYNTVCIEPCSLLFLINGPLKLVTMTQSYHGFQSKLLLPFYIDRHGLHQYPKVKKKNHEIMSNNENLSLTSAKAVLSLFVSLAWKQTKSLLQSSESQCGARQTESTPSEQVDIDRFIYREFYIQLETLKEYSKHFSHMIENYWTSQNQKGAGTEHGPSPRCDHKAEGTQT